MGNALQQQDKLKEAVEAYRKAISIKPDYYEAYGNLGAALQDQGKLDKAIKAYKKAIEIEPEYSKAFHNRWWYHTQFPNQISQPYAVL